MPISKEVVDAKDFCESLSSEQLDIICKLDFNKPKVKKDASEPDVRILSDADYLLALEWQYYALIELIGRLEYGFKETATDKWEAENLRKRAKATREKAKALRDADVALKKLFSWESEWHHVIDDIQEPQNKSKNTLAIKSFIPFKSPFRLLFPRINRPAGFIAGYIAAKNKTKIKAVDFLPRWFSFFAVENLFEFFYDIIVPIKAFFKRPRSPKNINEYDDLKPDQQTQIDHLRTQRNKVGRGERFFSKVFKGSRPTRLANAAIWLSINGAGIAFLIISLIAGIALSAILLPIPGLNIMVAATVISAALTLSGTVLDIIVDFAGSIYELLNLHSLFGKLEAKSTSKNFLNKKILDFTTDELAIKREESLVTRLLRAFTTDIAFAVGMLFITAATLSIAIPPVAAIVLLSACAVLALAELIPTLTLSNTRLNNIDKVRAVVAFVVILACVAFAVAMFFGAPFFTLAFIGGALAIGIAVPSLARRVARLDKDEALQTLINWKNSAANIGKSIINGIASLFSDKKPFPEPEKTAEPTATATTSETSKPLSKTTEITAPIPTKNTRPPSTTLKEFSLTLSGEVKRSTELPRTGSKTFEDSDLHVHGLGLFNKPALTVAGRQPGATRLRSKSELPSSISSIFKPTPISTKDASDSVSSSPRKDGHSFKSDLIK